MSNLKHCIYTAGQWLETIDDMIRTQAGEAAVTRVLPALPGPPAAEADPSLADVWLPVHTLMAHLRSFDKNESAVQAQQHGIIRDGCFLMPSPFTERPSDLCSQSWFHEYQFYFEFDAGSHGRYFWISSLLDRGFRLDTIWFPDRCVAVANYPSQMDGGRLERFAQKLAQGPAKPAAAPPWTKVPRSAVVGFQHFMHMLWNELPALDRLATTGLPGNASPAIFSIAVQHEPFGPMQELFPELAPWMRPLAYEDMPDWNATHGMVLGLGSRSITHGTQDRVLRVAKHYTGSDTLALQEAFKAAHDPVFWVSVKPPKRTLADQPAMLAGLIRILRAEHSNAGFILDGASLPWDFPRSPNYPPWFHSVSQTAVSGSSVIISMVMEMLDDIREHVVTLNGLGACEEATWGGIATFYVCHGGTMQNKIGWLHRIPGFVHSNLAFMRSICAAPPVVDGPACYYASADLIRDDNVALYSTQDLARKDQNYSLASLEYFVDEVRAAFYASREEGWTPG